MTGLAFPHDTVDQFAGPGGWSLAARRLGFREVGVETDKAAHLTRRAAGFHTVRASVTDLGPANFPKARRLISSPPCPTFSVSGKGSGRRELDAVLAGVHALASGAPLVHTWEDVRTGLTLEPMRWIVEAARLGRPFETIAMEQVPTVLPVWQAYAEELEGYGYTVAVGNLQAEQYGVPQTRKRAILVARLGGPVALPTPTHSRYHVKSPDRLDPGVLPWVSMAEALGWTDDTLVGFPRRADGRESVTLDGEEYRARDLREASSPAQAVTEKARSWSRVTLASDAHKRAYDRSVPRSLDRPAPTMAMGHASAGWAWTRPATTVVGSFSPETIAAPGYRVSAEDGSRQNAPGSIRVTEQEAAVLQSFPEDFPWQGSKTKRFQQIGNAIPPLLAEAVLRSVLA